MALWNKSYSEPGWFVRRSRGLASSGIGGSAWTVVTGAGAIEVPQLLLDVDLRDSTLAPALRSMVGPKRLPIATCIKSNLWENRQEYIFDDESRTIFWQTALNDGACQPGMSNLVGREWRPVAFEKMAASDLPTTEARYWSIGEAFLGGGDFFRLLGSPYWLQEALACKCSCGNEMLMVACVGSEGATTEPLMGDEPFFIGEAALYWFVCWDCRRAVVVAQPT